MSKHGFFTKWIHLVIAAVIATPIALTAFGGGGVAQAATAVISVGDAGADDEPGQTDLNALSVNYGEPGATGERCPEPPDVEEPAEPAVEASSH